MLVCEIVSAYLRHGQAVGLWCAESLAQRLQTFALFAEAFGSCQLEQLAAYHLADWIEAKTDWKSTATRKARANQINACFNWAVSQDRIPKNPFRQVKYQEAEPRPCLSDDDLTRLLDHANPRFAEVMRFLRLTGCRCSELRRTTWKDVDLQKGLVILVKHKSRRKTGRVRSFVLVAEAVALLQGIRRRQGQEYEGPVFVNTQGRTWSKQSLVWAFRRLADRLGLTTEASLHGIRHNFATIAVENGAPVKLISQQLGHASVTTTERFYVKASDVEAIRGAARLAAPVVA